MSTGEEEGTKPQEEGGMEEMTLAEREARWGFTIEELRSAAKVVRTLFHNPSLFVGDPYLHESRLYTMITRDRKTKRENRDVYKAIMNAEKSYRKRFKRMQDIEAVRRTEMKREREEALSLLQQQQPQPLDDQRASSISDRTDTLVESTTDRCVGWTTDDSGDICAHDREVIAYIGAFENIVRLESMYAAGPAAVDWAVASHLVAQVYRYLPHAYGTQMPPVLVGGHPPTGTGPLQRGIFTTPVKLRIAQRCSELFTLGEIDADDTDGNEGTNSNSECDMGREVDNVCVDTIPHCKDIIVRDSLSMRSVSCLRHCGTFSSVPSDVAQALEPHLPVEDILSVFGRAWDEGVSKTPFGCGEFTGFDTYSATASCDGEDNRRWSFDSSLNLYIARRLYAKRRFRNLGESPFNVQTRPPVSEDEEPDSFCVFQDIQQYAAGRPIPRDEALQLSKAIACHTCRVKYDKLHPYYYSMCHLCGEYNFNKRLMTRDLRGKAVLLTGCRIKIGFAMALSLLRCGAQLVGTTRFAHEALARFQQEADYEVWSHRLHIFSLDLRDMWLVTQFCAFVTQKFGKLFAIINNAAQTIARTREYTKHLRQVEAHPPLRLHNSLYSKAPVQEWHQYFLRNTSVTIGEPLQMEYHPQHAPYLEAKGGLTDDFGKSNANGNEGVISVVHTAEPTSAHGSNGHLIFDRYDTVAEESDHRVTNSWVMKLGEVQGSEAAEVMAINALSPFIINSKLKPCLLNREGDDVPNEPRFIINVSAMEGQFYRFKQVTHPHTNMAKAALNMMTRTSGEDYAQDGIYMNSVDTGWITDESPKEKKERRNEHHQLCPLDEVDAAARCLDLIYSNSRVYGKFFKDFKEIPW
uniref:Uncharacterized protein TCIL3000_11_8260 n=1 Tax=Trypanosoma congolense (strain IL3000) TaxID=1068625 RepID=G0V155_TRYCI|nr:unnamed protein product [Trypanosoma congolense IL3000]